MQEYKIVSLADIRPDPDQPRKYNNADELYELSQSIIKKGVLQPILVRPKKGKTPYMIVVGERRYKASLLAQVAKKEIIDIPAMVREISDEEALELQIIENLQRKDVHPLEEAFAFASLIKKKQLDVKEISARVGKSVGYVAQRVKLTELIKPFQELLFAHKMPFAQAQEICRFSEAIQHDIYREAKIPNKWETKEGWHLEKQNLWFISNHQHNLAQAAFKTEDPDLYPEMGKCGNCPYNSAANKLVFPDMPNKRICHNPGCYSIKTKRSYEQSIQQVMQQENMLFVNNTYYPGDEGKGKIKSIEDAGHKVLLQEQVQILKEPEHPGTMDEYVAEHSWKFENKNEDEKQQRYNQVLEEHEREKEKYQKLQSVAQKAFVVTGADEGKVVDVVLKAKNIKAGDVSNPITAIDLELEAIAEKEKRAQELDREKIMKEVQEALLGKFIHKKSNLIVLENLATIMAMIGKATSTTEKRICELLDIKQSGYHLDKMKVWNALKQITITQKEDYKWNGTVHEIHRWLLYDSFASTSNLDYEKNWEPAVLFSLQDAMEGTSQFIDAQNAKAKKRQSNAAKRKAELLTKKVELEAAKPALKAGKKPIKQGYKAPASVDV